MKTTTQPTAIDTLRAMYRDVRSGAALDTVAYVDALLGVAADGGDVWKILSAFDVYGYRTRLDILGACPGAGERIRAAYAARGWLGAIRVASLLSMSDVWASAMTAHYGPTGTHPSRLGDDGVPTLETLVEFPRVVERMARAAERFEGLLAYYDRMNAGNTHYLAQVVEQRQVKAA